MPKRTDIRKILVIGSGPIVIGQACEFDYSGTQAIRALREEGFSVVLVNSNPATIMTDPELSDAVYVEPLTPEFVERVIEREKPDAVLPTMGGQTALNLSLELHRRGVFKKHGIVLLGASPEAIEKAEDREKFKAVMDSIGVESAKSRVAKNLDDGRKILREIGLPLILRPSFTLGGEGGGAAFTEEEFLALLERALFLSPTGECLVEESLLGWKEFELEVVRDRNDNVIIVCSIENFDPMGVHTGDSITVAPAQTLTDREYQRLRDHAVRIIRAIGVETGGSNIQYAVHPENGRIVVIEMNPRVSRSSALASKATGFPIARVAAKLAVGYTLDELTNDITGTTPCSFEPSIDYVVVKVPRFDFEKFTPAEPLLTTQMKSVGEVMAMGHSFEEALGKALAGLEVRPAWLGGGSAWEWQKIETPHAQRIWHVGLALRAGASPEEVARRSGIDRWFLERMARFLRLEPTLREWPPTREVLLTAKQSGWSDHAIAAVVARPGWGERQVRELRESLGVVPAFQQVDTCAAEFEARTPYYYSTYAGSDEAAILDTHRKPRILILGGGPNRIGQGIEFDYCCVHAAMALREAGYETVMVNCNPETVSTDFDQSDRLYFEPLTPEHVLAISRIEKPIGAIVQLGGQTPLKIAARLEEGGLPILGTPVDSIDLAEDRERFENVVRELEKLDVLQAPAGTARTRDEAVVVARKLGFPLLLRPSYVLGGRGMRVIHSEAQLLENIDNAILQSGEHPILMDRFLNQATEVDVDAICDGEHVLIGGVMEHIEEAGIHSGDSACSLPAMSLSTRVDQTIREAVRFLAKRLGVRGLINAQFAVVGTSGGEQVYLLEVNPRASRTVPFVSKTIGIPLAKIAALVMAGRKLRDLGHTHDFDEGLAGAGHGVAVKAPVFVFHKFPRADILLGPEMKSTGEVMGRGKTFSEAYAKAITAAGMPLPREGTAFLSVRDEDKPYAAKLARQLVTLGFDIVATRGTAEFLRAQGVQCDSILKAHEAPRAAASAIDHCVKAIRDGRFQLVLNTTSDEKAIRDSFEIRRAVLERKVPYATVLSSARAMIEAIAALQGSAGGFPVAPLRPSEGVHKGSKS